MSKITDYAQLSSPQSDDLLLIVDVHDTSMAGTGTDKKIAVSALVPAATTGAEGTVQLAGDLAGAAASPQVTGTHLASPLPLAQGGTGQGSQQAALNALAGGTSSGQYLRGNGSNVALSALQAGDIPQLADYAPTGLTGATAASRYVGGTATSFPQSGTFSAGDWVADQSGAIWIYGAAARWMRAGDHSWQYRPESYGAKRDGRLLTDGAMTASSNILTSASAAFTTADTGKWFLVWAANTSSTYLLAQGTYASATTMTLSVSAGNTVSGTGVLYGSDDTAALQSAVNAATTSSLNGNGALAQVLLSEGIYCSSTAAATGVGTTLGNAAITLPLVSATSGVKAQVQIAGAGSSQLPHWTQPQPPQSGSIIAAMRITGSLNTTYGPTSIIGGPVDAYGGGGGTFNNMHLRLQGFTILVPVSTGAYCGPDLFGLGQASVDDVSYLPLAVVPASTTWPSLATYGSPTFYPTYSFALRMPAPGNNAVSDIGSFTSYFSQISLIASEHTTFASLKTLYSVYGWLPMSTGGTMAHGISGVNWCCEQVRYPIGSVTSPSYFKNVSPVGVTVARLSLETYTDIVNDAASNIYGTVGFDLISGATSYLGNQYAAGGTGVKLIRLEAASGPLASPQAVPTTGNPWPNYYYRDAFIEVALSGGTFSAFTVDAVSKPAAVGAAAYAFMLPSGHSYTPTFSAGTLTHTVTLL